SPSQPPTRVACALLAVLRLAFLRSKCGYRLAFTSVCCLHFGLRDTVALLLDPQDLIVTSFRERCPAQRALIRGHLDPPMLTLASPRRWRNGGRLVRAKSRQEGALLRQAPSYPISERGRTPSA